jgi:hypothetical protein
VHQLSGFRDDLAPEGDQFLGRIPGDAIDPDGIVLRVEQRGDGWQFRHGAEDVVEVIAITVGWALLKIAHLPLSGLLAPLMGTGK